MRKKLQKEMVLIQDGSGIYENEDAGDWTVEDIAKWEYLVGRQTIIRKAFNICSEELYLGEFLPNL